MFLRIGSRILNTDNITDADIIEPGEGLFPHQDWHADERTVVITTTATETGADGTLAARRIILEGVDADIFLEALPVYSPVLEET